MDTLGATQAFWSKTTHADVLKRIGHKLCFRNFLIAGLALLSAGVPAAAEPVSGDLPAGTLVLASASRPSRQSKNRSARDVDSLETRQKRQETFRRQLTDLILDIMNQKQSSSASQEMTTPQLEWSGNLMTEFRWQTKDPFAFTWRELRLELNGQLKVTDQSSFYTSLWIRNQGVTLTAVSNPPALFNADALTPWSLNARELYCDFYNFLIPNLDLRLGRQRIAWGRGDKVNPTDNINPYDLEDPLDFSRHLGSDGIKITYHPGDLIFTAVYLPLFTPSVLPAGTSLALPIDSAATTPYAVASQNSVLSFPDPNPAQSSTYALKVEKNLAGYDFSASYLDGPDIFPYATKIAVPSVSFSHWPEVQLNLLSTLGYPRRKIIGCDAAGALGPVGVWAEAALFLPSFSNIPVDLTAISWMGGGVPRSMTVTVDNTPYVKYLFGGDYNFGGGLYANVQFLHGFSHEIGAGMLEDYFFLNLEWEIIEKIKLIPVSAVCEFKYLRDVFKEGRLDTHYGLLYMPSAVLRLIDNLALECGAAFFQGDPGTTLGKSKGQDRFFFKLKYSF